MLQRIYMIVFQYLFPQNKEQFNFNCHPIILLLLMLHIILSKIFNMLNCTDSNYKLKVKILMLMLIGMNYINVDANR